MSKIKAFFQFLSDLWQMVITYCPGRVGNKLRYLYWKKRLKYLGPGVRIDVGVYFSNPAYVSLDEGCWIDRNVIILSGPPGMQRIAFHKENEHFRLETGEVYIGPYSHIAPNCVLSGIGGIYVGRNCGVASNSTIYSFSHHYRNLVDRSDHYQYSFTPLTAPDLQAMVLGPVVIEDYCAVGLNSTILPGVTVRRGSWVGSGTVLNRTYPEQSVIFAAGELQVKDISHLHIKTQ